MKITSNYIIILFLMSALLLSACTDSKTSGEDSESLGEDTDHESVTLTTAGTSGTFYSVGAAFTQIINNNSDLLAVTNQASGGSIENIRLLSNEEVEFAILSGDVAVDAYNGKGEFDGEPQDGVMKGLFSMYSQPLTLVTLADSGIRSFSDLEGKKVAVGAPGSGNEVESKITLEALGLPYDTGIKQEYLPFGEAVDAMKDGQIDAAFVWAGVPAPAVQDLAAVRDIFVVPFTDGEIEKVNKAHEAFYEETIPSETYDGVNEDIQTLAVSTQVVVRHDIDEDLVYDFTKQIFDNIEDIYAAHNSMKEMTLESAPQNVIELHPGAKKFFEEKETLAE